MSTVIQLLEKIGSEALLVSKHDLKEAIEGTNLSLELKKALLNNDSVSLERQLDVCPDVYCVLLPAEDEPEEPPEEDESESIKAA